MFKGYVWRLVFSGVGATCMTVFEDNEGTRHLLQNPVCTLRSKHIDVRHHFLRELVARKEIAITHVRSDLQHADFLTKAITQDSFEFHRDFTMNL